MKKVITMLLLAALLAVPALSSSEIIPSDNDTLNSKRLIAFKEGEGYAFFGLAKFELNSVYHRGTEVDYSVFYKYYGYSESDISIRSTELYDEATGITLFGTKDRGPTAEDLAAYKARFELYESVVYGSESFDFSDFVGTVDDSSKPAAYEDRLVGVAYSTWMYNFQNVFASSWETPLLGNYTSLGSPKTVKAHGELLYDAGVDFVFVDWSNNVDYDFYTKKDGAGNARRDFETIESATTQLFSGWSKLENSPKIAIFIGCPGDASAVSDGRLTGKADQVYKEYVTNEKYASLYQTYLGKPLLLVYLGTPSFAQSRPSKMWDDERFTVRFITGFVGQQAALFNKRTMLSKFNIWSWEERGAQTFSVYDDTVECMTVQSAWRAQGKDGDADYIAPGEREDGMTFLKMWARARAYGPQFVLCPTWNEYSKGEQPTREINKDLEPTKQNGTLYYDILKEQIALFKNTKAETPVVTEPVTTVAEVPTDTAQPSSTVVPSTKPETTAPDTPAKLNGGLIAAIVGGVVALAAVCVIVLKLKKKK